MVTMTLLMSDKDMEAIRAVLCRGNTAEVKIEHGKVVVIELRRKKVNTECHPQLGGWKRPKGHRQLCPWPVFYKDRPPEGVKWSEKT